MGGPRGRGRLSRRGRNPSREGGVTPFHSTGHCSVAPHRRTTERASPMAERPRSSRRRAHIRLPAALIGAGVLITTLAAGPALAEGHGDPGCSPGLVPATAAPVYAHLEK